jgi:hypothetical protein
MGRERVSMWISRYTGFMKILLSLEERLVRRIDLAAGKLGLSRSAYIAQLAKRNLGGGKGPGRSPAARGALRRLDRLFESNPHPDAAGAVRAERDAR